MDCRAGAIVLHWPAEAFWLWWSTQPEVMAADEAARSQAWQMKKMENRTQREQQKLMRPGVSRYHVGLLRRLAGVTHEDIRRRHPVWDEQGQCQCQTVAV